MIWICRCVIVANLSYLQYCVFVQQAEILNQLKALDIDFDVVSHPPLFHEGDADKYGVKLNCTSSKCLVLTNKDKSHYYLVILPLSEKVDIKTLQSITNEKKLSFSDAETVTHVLNATTGSVSLLSLFFADKTNLTVFVSKALLSASKVGFHPNENIATVIFDSTKIKIILDAIKVNWQEL